jgi:lipopolysaccharide transport system ATP-binding protein
MQQAIKIEHVSKVYRLGATGSNSFREDLNHFVKHLMGKTPNLLEQAGVNNRENVGDSNLIRALDDINISVSSGEVVGIVGRNGAGKSTLLKILSRTTAPTSGLIKINGRMASLLEVGTGFHPDMTGRENIFLNGAILGMRRHEIKARLDEIVEFAGVRKYLDTPVKRYSSGMYVRLAFAVAAHLEPDILIIDEVLAVGDAEFQSKCIGKMKDVSGSGRTVLFVSHNMGAVSDLCNRAVLLQHGCVLMDGGTDQVIKKYLELNMQVDLSIPSALNDSKMRRGNSKMRFTEVKIYNHEGMECYEFDKGEAISISMKFIYNPEITEVFTMFALKSGKSREVITSTNRNQIDVAELNGGEEVEVRYSIPSLNLRTGVYETFYLLGRNDAETVYDVVDNLLPPITIRIPKNESGIMIRGYFDIDFSYTTSNQKK